MLERGGKRRYAVQTPERIERATLTVAEAGKLLGISRNLAYELVAQGKLPTLRLGRRLVVPRVALQRLLEEASVVCDESA